MALASDVLRLLSVGPGGGLAVAGAISAVGATLDPGGLDVKQVSTFRNNLTVEGALFTAINTATQIADGPDLSVNLPGTGPVWDFWGTVVMKQGSTVFSVQPDGSGADQAGEGLVAEASSSFSFALTAAEFADADPAADGVVATIEGSLTYFAGVGTRINFTALVTGVTTGSDYLQLGSVLWAPMAIAPPTSVNFHAQGGGDDVGTGSVIKARMRP